MYPARRHYVEDDWSDESNGEVDVVQQDESDDDSHSVEKIDCEKEESQQCSQSLSEKLSNTSIMSVQELSVSEQSSEAMETSDVGGCVATAAAIVTCNTVAATGTTTSTSKFSKLVEDFDKPLPKAHPVLSSVVEAERTYSSDAAAKSKSVSSGGAGGSPKVAAKKKGWRGVAPKEFVPQVLDTPGRAMRSKTVPSGGGRQRPAIVSPLRADPNCPPVFPVVSQQVNCANINFSASYDSKSRRILPLKSPYGNAEQTYSSIAGALADLDSTPVDSSSPSSGDTNTAVCSGMSAVSLVAAPHSNNQGTQHDKTAVRKSAKATSYKQKAQEKLVTLQKSSAVRSAMLRSQDCGDLTTPPVKKPVPSTKRQQAIAGKKQMASRSVRDIVPQSPPTSSAESQPSGSSTANSSTMDTAVPPTESSGSGGSSEDCSTMQGATAGEVARFTTKVFAEFENGPEERARRG